MKNIHFVYGDNLLKEKFFLETTDEINKSLAILSTRSKKTQIHEIRNKRKITIKKRAILNENNMHHFADKFESLDKWRITQKSTTYQN